MLELVAAVDGGEQTADDDVALHGRARAIAGIFHEAAAIETKEERRDEKQEPGVGGAGGLRVQECRRGKCAAFE